MNASAKWLRRALLGSVALGAMATGAQADDLTALKAQLEALQSRVNQLESTGPAASAGAPEGASYISFRRGSDLGWDMSNLIPADERLMDDRGFTVAITPTADLPAPIMEVAISGYVKADFLYDTHNFMGDGHTGPVAIGGGDDENVRLHARQSRFRITSKSDTAVGQIRTLIETDFFGAGNTLRLRHAWGEWDMTPNTTFGAGQFWTNFYSQAGQINTIDFGAVKGTSDGISRQSQFRITHRAGPATISVAVEDPGGNSFVPAGASSASSTGGDHDLPDLTARAAFSLGSASVQVSGLVLENHLDSAGAGAGTSDSSIGYGLAAGVDIPFGEMITLYGHAAYTDGASRYISGGASYNAILSPGGNLRNTELFGYAVGASFKLSEASTINAGYSAVHVTDNRAASSIKSEEKVHVNYLWQPVSKLRMGVEGIWQEDTYGGGLDDDNIRLQFATWFFF
jgi:hypothetical protein